MKTNQGTPRIEGVIACAIAILALTAGASLAAGSSTMSYYFSSHPMISGTVVTVNDHQMVVDTDQGEQVTLEMDSRTMAPRDLAPGMVMRAEFLAQEDCHFYAQRILPLRDGTSPGRRQAYANSQDSREAIVRSASASAGYREEGGESQAGAESRMSPPQTMGEHSPGTVMTAAPATADYEFSTRPMISGRVVSVNDHRLVVETDQGRQVGLVMDSRTMVPGEVAPGTTLRAEFSQMKDGRYYAKRVSQIGSGVAAREQAYAHTRDSDVLVARNVPDCGFVSAATPNTTAAAVERRGVSEAPAPAVEESAEAPVVEKPRTLPQTGSLQPLTALLGFLLLGAASAVAIGRRLCATQS